MFMYRDESIDRICLTHQFEKVDLRKMRLKFSIMKSFNFLILTAA